MSSTSSAAPGRAGTRPAALLLPALLIIAACSQPVSGGGKAPAAAPSSGRSSPACDLITPEIAAKAVPGVVVGGQDSAEKPRGSKAYTCVYTSKSMDGGLTGLSVALISPASAEDIAKAKSTPDCAPVSGIGDFACLQWTGYFQGETGGASANAVLVAVKGGEVLEMPYVVSPPVAGSPAPDGNAMAGALAQAAVEAGWGNGATLSVPAAPAPVPAGPAAR